MSEPKDAAAARDIIAAWQHPVETTPEKYAMWLRVNLHGNARWSHRSPALNVVETPPMPVKKP